MIQQKEKLIPTVVPCLFKINRQTWSRNFKSGLLVDIPDGLSFFWSAVRRETVPQDTARPLLYPTQGNKIEYSCINLHGRVAPC